MEHLRVLNRGTVQSHTTLQMPPEGFPAPLSMALVELESGAMILCLARSPSESSVSIGDEVEVTLDSEDRFLYHLIN
ncbi:MAG: Zn-ribbon domain-containing OB-fold protein [Promethearchaeota archaeon]